MSSLEAAIVVQHPDRHMQLINVGLPSETVSGLSEPGHAGGQFPRPDLHERLQRVLEQTKPELVVACYGMNDGIYYPLGDDRLLPSRVALNACTKRWKIAAQKSFTSHQPSLIRCPTKTSCCRLAATSSIARLRRLR